jgi:hypothetical protein
VPKAADTLANERARIAAIIASGTKGTHCQACGQLAKKWRFRFHSTMARYLILLVRKYEATGDYAHVRELQDRENYCISMARKWGLVESEPHTPGVRGTGRWRPTQDGIDFARNRSKIWSHVFFFDDKVLGHTGKMISIVEALGKKFDYAELING